MTSSHGTERVYSYNPETTRGSMMAVYHQPVCNRSESDRNRSSLASTTQVRRCLWLRHSNHMMK